MPVGNKPQATTTKVGQWGRAFDHLGICGLAVRGMPAFVFQPWPACIASAQTMRRSDQTMPPVMTSMHRIVVEGSSGAWPRRQMYSSGSASKACMRLEHVPRLGSRRSLWGAKAIICFVLGQNSMVSASRFFCQARLDPDRPEAECLMTVAKQSNP